MTDHKTDHKAVALALLVDSSHAGSNEFAAVLASRAQVHATLHLADVIAQKGANQ